MARNKSRYPKVRGRTFIGDLVDYLDEEDWDLVRRAVFFSVHNTLAQTQTIEKLRNTEVHRIDVSHSCAGLVWYSPPRLDLHTYIMNTPGQEAELRDTLFHEIAHLIAKFGLMHQGHGQPWKEVFSELGFPNGERCHSLGRLTGTTGKPRTRTVYVYGCNGCGHETEQRRKWSQPGLWHHNGCRKKESRYVTRCQYKETI